ncbi:hypothetical protein I4U23_027294 [Adineta vaga]|nr:hypothetical protein I4U23_027294 [Adineta vaga]
MFIIFNDINDNPLIFWKKQESLLSSLSKLAKRTFCIPAFFAAVKRVFSWAGTVICQRRNTLNPSTVNDITLVRSASLHADNQL